MPRKSMNTSEQTRIKQHELYRQYEPLWRFYLDAYQGTGPFLTGEALIKFGRESELGYMNRRAQVYYPNFCAPILDFYVSMIFKRGVQRELAASAALQFNEFITNVDRRSTHIEDFMREVALFAQIFGFCPVLVDMPRANTATILTKFDQMQAGLVPYFTIIPPFNVWDWKTTPQGDLEYVLIYEGVIQETPRIEQFRYWDRERWEVIRLQDGVEQAAESGQHGLGVVPLVSIKNQKLFEDSFLGLSALRDIARANQRLMNMYSELDQILRNQTFSILIMPYDPESSIASGEGERSRIIDIGTDNALRFNPESGHAPQFISPDASQGQLYLEAISRLVQEIYRLARLEQLGVSRELSGIAYSYSFRNTNSVLAQKADELERGETALWKLWCAWQGADFTGVVRYPDEFDIQDRSRLIADALDLQALGVGSITFDRVLRKQIANAVLENVSDATLQKIFDEIDARSSFAEEPSAGEEEETVSTFAGGETPEGGV